MRNKIKPVSLATLLLLLCMLVSLASCQEKQPSETTMPETTGAVEPSVTTEEPDVTTEAEETTEATTTEDPNTPKKPKIAVLSGAGAGSKIYSKMVEMTGKKNPRCIILSTAGKDSVSTIQSYRNTMGKYTNDIEVITLCTKLYKPDELRSLIVGADMIIEVGGQSEFMGDTWEKFNLPEYLLEAYNNGTVICGGSAGGMCWTYAGWNDFYELPESVYKWYYGIDALHFYYGSHYHDNANWTKFHDNLMAITDPKYPIGYAMDNGTGIVVVDGVATEFLREKTGIYIWKYTFENGKWTCVRQEDYK